MKYTLSLYDNDIEITRYIFDEVRITPTTIITSSTDLSKELKLKIDYDGDNIIDRTLIPTVVLDPDGIYQLDNQKNIEQSNYSLIANDISGRVEIESNKLTIESNILSQGITSVKSNNHRKLGVVNASKYIINDIAQEFVQSNILNNIDVDGFEQSIENYREKSVNEVYNLNTKNIILSEDIFSKGDINIDCNVINTEAPIIIYSSTSDIYINTKNMQMEGVIYAPNGNIYVDSNKFEFDGLIIAKNIYIVGKNVTLENNLKLSQIERK